ncbi:hypothetical protein PS624_00909 [Pseudomonas fluorescens]|uniref:Uncharacterized protein n=1 Tax=Pseudomonas fluorescens TaxID=294 RepID=A0A5E6QB47_PSEFL|nr:hypothetical protein PS624_00909 [Pseudomonas fluorescens]
MRGFVLINVVKLRRNLEDRGHLGQAAEFGSQWYQGEFFSDLCSMSFMKLNCQPSTF